MLTQAEGQFGKSDVQKSDVDAQIKLFRSGVMIAMGLFAGTVMGGIVGLFVYANSRTPNLHDGVFAVIQAVGVILGVGMGYLAARSSEAQERLIEASQRAGMMMLRKYRPKPGNAGHGNVGHRTIATSPVGQRSPSASKDGEDFLKTLLNKQ